MKPKSILLYLCNPPTGMPDSSRIIDALEAIGNRQYGNLDHERSLFDKLNRPDSLLGFSSKDKNSLYDNEYAQ